MSAQKLIQQQTNSYNLHAFLDEFKSH